jgi:hypothetical protein
MYDTAQSFHNQYVMKHLPVHQVQLLEGTSAFAILLKPIKE